MNGKISNEYVENVLSVVQYFLDHVNTTISDDVIMNISPRYGHKIMHVFEEEGIGFPSKDGIYFDNGDVDALNSYLSELKDNLPEEPERIDVWLNRIEKITTIGSNMTTIQNSQLT